MTTDKARKRAVRERMTKTGERYAAARRHVVRRAPSTPTPAGPPAAGRRTDDVRRDRSARAPAEVWDEWFRLLDAWGATAHTHTEIARHVRDDPASMAGGPSR